MLAGTSLNHYRYQQRRFLEDEKSSRINRETCHFKAECCQQTVIPILTSYPWIWPKQKLFTINLFFVPLVVSLEKIFWKSQGSSWNICGNKEERWKIYCKLITYMKPLKWFTQGIRIPSNYYGIMWKIKNYGKIKNLNM